MTGQPRFEVLTGDDKGGALIGVYEGSELRRVSRVPTVGLVERALNELVNDQGLDPETAMRIVCGEESQEQGEQ